METSRLLRAASALAIATCGLAIAPSAGAAQAAPTNHAHFPGTFWANKADCQAKAQGYVARVKAAGFTSTSPSDGHFHPVAADQFCHAYTKGWSYVSTYNVPAGKQAFSGDLSSGSAAAKDRVDKGGYATRTYHHAYDFDSKAARDKAYAAVRSTVAASPRVEMVDAVSQDMRDPLSGERWYSYSISYNGSADGALYPYETWVDSSIGGSALGSTGTTGADKKDKAGTSNNIAPQPWDSVYHMGELTALLS